MNNLEQTLQQRLEWYRKGVTNDEGRDRLQRISERKREYYEANKAEILAKNKLRCHKTKIAKRRQTRKTFRKYDRRVTRHW